MKCEGERVGEVLGVKVGVTTEEGVRGEVKDDKGVMEKVGEEDSDND